MLQSQLQFMLCEYIKEKGRYDFVDTEKSHLKPELSGEYINERIRCHIFDLEKTVPQYLTFLYSIFPNCMS